MNASGINRQDLIDLFTRMDDALVCGTAGTPRTLCVFGASAVLLYGSDDRLTQHVDVWRAASDLADQALAAMTAHAGRDLNPTDLEPRDTYLKIVQDGAVALPIYDKERRLWAGGKPSETLWEGRHLTVVAPPPAIVAAAKMVRAEPKDVEDVIYIMASRALTTEDIAAAATRFPQSARERADANLVYLRLVASSATPVPGTDDSRSFAEARNAFED